MEHTKNHLTIHLYRKDEALASIRWAIVCRNHTEAIFWGLELYDSNMETDAIQMLAFTWITCIGFGSLTCLESLQKLATANREEWCQILMAWCKVTVHDTTAFHLLLRGASTPTTWQPRFVHTKPYTDLDDALYTSLRRGKLTEAWLIARAMNSETQWATIRQVAAEKKRQSSLAIVYSSQLSDVERRAAAFTLVSLDGPILNSALAPLYSSNTLPIELQEAINRWDAEDSLRKRRIFKVRYEAILYLCQRSSQPVSESSESEIQHDLEKSLVASSYWQQVLKAHIKPKKGEATDRNIEDFYDLFFNYKLHDIPDEWSLADREKSHGRGLGKSDEQAKKHFIDTTVQRSTTLGLWNSKICGSSYSILANLNWPTLYDELHGSCFESLSLPITPQQKQFEIQLC